jgi:hypothetical protein
MSDQTIVGVCRSCGCTVENGCALGCCWVEPDLCSVCDGSIDAFAFVIAEFTMATSATENNTRFTKAINVMLREASARLKAESLAEEPLIQVVG